MKEVFIVGIVGKWLESLDYQYNIKENTCVRHKSPFATCQACVDVCSENAIFIRDGKPAINQKSCIECGKCLSSCPVQAIAGIYPKREVVNGYLIIEKRYIPSAKELLIYRAKGIKTLVIEPGEMNGDLSEVLTRVNEQLDKLNEEPFEVKTEVTRPKIEEVTYSRRELFSLWKKESKTFLSQVTPAKWRFNQTDFKLAKYYPEHQFYSVNIDSSTCSLCEICTSLCEKQCFAIDDKQLTISSQTCSNCRLCIDVCPEKSISIVSNITEAQQTKYPLYKKTCTSCKKDFLTIRNNDQQCFVCNKRQAGYLS